MDEAPDLSGTTILLVEDHADTRQMLRLYIEPTHAHVVEAADAYEALSQVARHRPHLIFCDLTLPGMGGIAFVERFSRDSGFCRIPVIAVSGHGDSSDFRETWAAGFNGHLVKPITQPMILAQLRRIFWAHVDS